MGIEIIAQIQHFTRTILGLQSSGTGSMDVYVCLQHLTDDIPESCAPV
jgi:hypothetical protein